MPHAPRLGPGLRRLPVAHRALHDLGQGRPENSRAAIRAAIDAGYAIEIDLQLSRDGQAVVFHDDDLPRLTNGTGLVRDHDLADLARLRLQGSDETIPTLAEVLDLVGARAPLLIELKDQTGRLAQTDGRLEEATARLLAAHDGEVAVMSFNPHCVALMADLLPDVPRGRTTCSFSSADWGLPEARCAQLRAITDLKQLGARFVSHEAADLGRPVLGRLAAMGIDILCWTIRDPQAELQARRHARNITFEGYMAAHPD